MKKVKNKVLWIRISKKREKNTISERKKKKRINRIKNKLKYSESKDKNQNKRIKIEYCVPTNFSFFYNTDEVVKFFNLIISNLKSIERKGKGKYYLFNIDMKNVERIEPDALMYLLTIMRNSNITNKNNIWWKGNYPLNSEVKKLLIETGFTKYVRTNSSNIAHESETLQIKYGNILDPNVTMEACNLIIKNAKVDRTKVLFIRETVNEFMDNTMGHAYEKNTIFDPCWYLFVKCDTDKAVFTFLDNGLGIPYTVKKTLIEILKDKFYKRNDGYYIKSALDGEFRSETGKSNRGKGLPEVYNNVIEHNIKKFSIISNNGIFKENTAYESRECFFGTLIYFEIDFNNLRKEKK